MYTASRFLNQGVVFLLLPLYAHLLGTEGVGVIEVLNVSRAFLAALFAQGLEGAWFRFRFGATSEARARLESTLLLYLVGTGAVGLLVLYVAGDFLAPWLTRGVPFHPMGFLAAATASTLIFPALVERRFQGDQQPLAFATWTLLRTLVTTLSIVLFVAVLRRGALGKVEAETAAGLLLALASLLVLRPKPAFSAAELRRGLAYGLPLVPHTFAGLTNDLVDRFILSSLLGLSAVGVYSMGYRIAGIAMTMMVAVNQAFAPVFVGTLQEATKVQAENPAEAEKLRARIASVAFVNIVVGCLVAQCVAAGARELLELATTPAFAQSFRVVGPVCAGVVAWTWYGVLSQTVAFRPETVRRMPLITIAAAVTNVALNYALVPWLGMAGAAWATFGSNAAMALAAYLLGRKILPLPFAFPRWIRATVWALTSLVVIAYLDRHVEPRLTRTALKTAWLAIACGVTLGVSGVGPREIRGAMER